MGLCRPMKTIKSPMALLRLLATLGCVATVALSSGCFLVAVGAAGAAGAGAVAYVRGELDATLSGGLDNVARASDVALDQLRFARISEGNSAVDAEVIARTGQDKKIIVRLNRTADNLTRVRIRVGTFGDEPTSRLLLDKIKANL